MSTIARPAAVAAEGVRQGRVAARAVAARDVHARRPRVLLLGRERLARRAVADVGLEKPMLKIAVLDDYASQAMRLADWSPPASAAASASASLTE